MRARVRESSFANAPQEVLRSGWSRVCKPEITIGHEYEVYSILVSSPDIPGSSRLINFLIVEDNEDHNFLPSFLFEVTDRTLRSDWQCNLLPSGTFVIGPSFIVESHEACEAMAGKEDAESRRKFYEYVLRIEQQKEERENEE